jgi:hypothetical protein
MQQLGWVRWAACLVEGGMQQLGWVLLGVLLHLGEVGSLLG